MVGGQPNREIHPPIKARQLVSTEMSYVGTTSDQSKEMLSVPDDHVGVASGAAYRDVRCVSHTPGTGNFNKVALASACFIAVDAAST
ncbi:hypothetical protein CEXT_378981 [Caerostris extrusa]|uniref:Uncharacterized protein n=1 Tax=Caerostris extrusa TaxID=172846 RepID=A0AAV4P1K0_CAEEX|nr:hypothetical protein CEXT_378981 [Caerostris extrusa]